MDEMRGLTIQQPFAWAIAYGGKDVENRPKPVRYRGLVAIHAGLEMHSGSFPVRSGEEVREAARALDKLGGRGNCWNPRHHIQTALAPVPHPGLALGAVIAVAKIVACHHESTEEPPNSCSPWAVRGQYHWFIAEPRPLAVPVPCRGMLGLWRLPEDAERAVRERLEAGDG